MATFDVHDKLRIKILLAGGLVLAGSAWLVGDIAVRRAVEAVAIAAANDWADYLSAAMPDVEDVVRGQQISPAAEVFVDQSRRFGGVFRFRIFDMAGNVQLDSGTLSTDERHDDKAMTVKTARSGETSVFMGSGDGVGRPEAYAVAYAPLEIQGRIRGVTEVYVDLVTSAPAVRTTVVWSSLGLAGLTALSFLIPLGAYLMKAAEARRAITYHAKHDDLTQLNNRSAFKAAVQSRVGKGDAFEVLFVNVDRFRNVNDAHGHHFGDQLLRQFASRLRDIAGPLNEVSRFGGDEFALVRACSDEAPFGGNLVGALAGIFVVEGVRTQIDASVGIARYPDDGRTTEELLQAADIALSQVKQNGGGRSLRFEPSMEERVRRRNAVEARLKTALELNEFFLEYQPLVGPTRLVGFEALLRLRDESGQSLAPSAFIPVAEQTGLIIPLGAFALKSACITAATWPEHLKVSVNLSPIQFRDGNLVRNVREALFTSGLRPGQLELEITESVLITDTATVMGQLQDLRALGVTVALDDFGTGYSSLSYLWQFPFDRVKIDRSFVSRLTTGDPRSTAMLNSIIVLCRSLGMSITAEGVETVEQATMLESMNVDTLQGYLFGRPVPEASVDLELTRLQGGVSQYLAVRSVGSVLVLSSIS